MAWEKRGPFAGNIDRVGKGSERRQARVDEQTVAQNGARTFGEEWLIPPVLRRRAQAQDDTHTRNSAGSDNS